MILHTELCPFIGELVDSKCVSVNGKLRQCNCMKFLGDKPAVVNAAADALIIHFNSDIRWQRISLLSVNIITLHDLQRMYLMTSESV